MGISAKALRLWPWTQKACKEGALKSGTIYVKQSAGGEGKNGMRKPGAVGPPFVPARGVR